MGYSGPETCGACHADRYELWSIGPHAHALDNPIFQEDWAASGYSAYCLACHTTGYDPNTGEYALEAVTCEACHGPYNSDHPPAVVEVDRTGDICRNCHPQAFDEWRASPHGLAGTKCIACHQICSLETMPALDGHAVCETCHGDDANYFHGSTHNTQGLDCIDCHMQPGPGEVGHIGQQHIAHVFSANPESCLGCHAETIHIANDMIELEAQVVSLEESGVTDLQEEVYDLENEMGDLRANVASRLYAGLLGGAIVGVAVGAGLGLFWKRWQRGRPI